MYEVADSIRQYPQCIGGTAPDGRLHGVGAQAIASSHGVAAQGAVRSGYVEDEITKLCQDLDADYTLSSVNPMVVGRQRCSHPSGARDSTLG